MKYKIYYPYIIFTIDQPISIDDFFNQFHLSKKTIHLLKQNKQYSVNNTYVSSNTILKENDLLKIKAFDEDDGMYIPIYKEIDVVYEDDFLLIVNKPPHLPIYPDHQDKTESLAHYVSGYYHMNGYNLPVRFIHRLDNDTSGLVIFCKCALIQPLLDYQLSIKDIKRYYLAVVEGIINNKKYLTINKPIGNDRHHNSRMIISKSGKEAITHYKSIKYNQKMSLIECVLDTGRKHQIRVHLASISHPIVGDPLYGVSKHLTHQALHAYKIELIHPITKEKMTFTCHPPYDMHQLMKKIDPTL